MAQKDNFVVKALKELLVLVVTAIRLLSTLIFGLLTLISLIFATLFGFVSEICKRVAGASSWYTIYIEKESWGVVSFVAFATAIACLIWLIMQF